MCNYSRNKTEHVFAETGWEVGRRVVQESLLGGGQAEQEGVKEQRAFVRFLADA